LPINNDEKSKTESLRLQKEVSVLNTDQQRMIFHLWKKYKNLDQLHGTRELKDAFNHCPPVDRFLALFLGIKNLQHKKFYPESFLSHTNDLKIPKGCYRFSLDFQEKILKTKIL